MKEENGQLRIEARLYSSDGKYKEITLVHDTGAAATILKGGDALLWDRPGDGTVAMGGFTGEREHLRGGNDLCLMLKCQEESWTGLAQDGLDMDILMSEIMREEESPGVYEVRRGGGTR